MVILVELFDENPQVNQNAAKLDGDVNILMQKGRDQASAIAIALDGKDLVAEVRNGEWQSQPIGLEYFANNGFDTMVAEFQGNRVYRSLAKRQSNNPAPAASQARQQNQQSKVVIDVTALEPTATDDGKKCDVSIAGIVTNNNIPVVDAQLDLFYQGRIETVCQLAPGIKSDDNGRFSHTFAGRPADGKRAKLEIQIRGGIRRAVEVDIPPAPKEKEKPETLKASSLEAIASNGTLVGDKMIYNVTLIVRDQKKQCISAGDILWNCGTLSGTTNSGTGYATITVEVDQFDAKWAFLAHSPTASLISNQVELAGPPKKAADKKLKYNIEAKLDAPHPVGDKFVISGNVTIDNKPGDCICVVYSSPEDVEVEGRLGKIEPGSDPNTFNLTPSKGNFKLVVKFVGSENELSITTPDGTTATVPMVKPK
ncbi:MAG: hypothetical protein HY918_04990 [Candidatus Doudnabacteria bacterium]|nr:hypothetical protein [Candidatus Doudnabacteria bacterium]